MIAKHLVEIPAPIASRQDSVRIPLHCGDGSGSLAPLFPLRTMSSVLTALPRALLLGMHSLSRGCNTGWLTTQVQARCILHCAHPLKKEQHFVDLLGRGKV
ncbi:hypothetical protein ALP85_00456 [Pseudomonas syringae pv. syringae]|nr:hypothetical protein ALP85_00456 [Pseudomonas syringae pv. syringae]